MDLIDRYVYAVTKSLPVRQRDDIEKELRTLIDDMVEEYGESETYEEEVRKVLTSLGNPEKLAENYRDSKRYLIGPGYIDKYFVILKIVFSAVFVGVSVANAVEWFFASDKVILDMVLEYITSVLFALLQGFAWVTFGFAIAERNEQNRVTSKGKGNEWKPDQLPEIPKKEAVIAPVDCILSIIFSTVFICLVYFYPQVIAAYFRNPLGGMTVIPVFDPEVIETARLLFTAIFLVTVIKEAMKLIAGRWNLKVSAAAAVLSLAVLVLNLLIFTNPRIWNQDFAAEIIKHSNLDFDIVKAWSQFYKAFIMLLIAGSSIEIVTTLYKGMKYGTSAGYSQRI